MRPLSASQLKQLLLSSLLLGASLAQATVLKEPAWQSLLDKGRLEELEQAAQARLKQSPADLQAQIALAMVARDGSDAKAMEAAVRTMEQCVAQQPREAVCHYALGQVLGTQAMSASMFKAISLSGKIKDAFSRAVELDPAMPEARAALQQFYLMAPGVAGGSLPKAAQLAAEVRESLPELAKLMRARVAQQEDKIADAERELLSIKPGADAWLLAEWRQALGSHGIGYFQDKQWAKARTWYEQVQQVQPQAAWGPYGLGRVALEQGQFDEAIKLLERARTLEGTETLPIDYRLGLALLGKGEKAQAKQALERFLTLKRANPRNLEDARKRLASLG